MSTSSIKNPNTSNTFCHFLVEWIHKNDFSNLLLKNLEYEKSLSDPAEILIYKTEKNTPKTLSILQKHTTNNTRK